MMSVPAMFTRSTSLKDGFRNSFVLKNNFTDAFGWCLMWYGWSQPKNLKWATVCGKHLSRLGIPFVSKTACFQVSQVCSHFPVLWLFHTSNDRGKKKKNLIKDLGSQILLREYFLEETGD